MSIKSLFSNFHYSAVPLWAKALAPVEWVYQAAASQRNKQFETNKNTTVKLGDIPVISIGTSRVKDNHELILGVKGTYFQNSYSKSRALGYDGDYIRKRYDFGLFGGMNAKVYRSMNLEVIGNFIYTYFQHLPQTSLDYAFTSKRLNLSLSILPNLRIRINDVFSIKIYAGVSAGSMISNWYQLHNPNIALDQQKTNFM